MPTDTATSIDLIGPEFWVRPLEERMADFAVLREEAPFIRSSFEFNRLRCSVEPPVALM